MNASIFFAQGLTPSCSTQDKLLGVNFLKAWRLYRGLTGDELGSKLDPPASAGTISSYETGKRLVGPRRLAQIAEVLGTTQGKLLDEPPPLKEGAPVVTMPAEVIDIWDHIPLERRSQAIALLRVLTRPDEEDSDVAQT